VRGEGESVAVGVFEPGGGGASGGEPDAVGFLLEVAEAEEVDSLPGELGDGGVDVLDFPTEDGEGGGGEVAGGADDAEHGLGGAYAEDEGERVLGDEGQGEGLLVEDAGGVGVGGGDEGDGVEMGEGHLGLRVGRVGWFVCSGSVDVSSAKVVPFEE
jgi:hypothetical protein